MTYRKKLIEVALPLVAINTASAREKSIRHGHPSTLHLWWARRPLATCRAVLFASLVDDPSEHPEEFPTEQDQTQERERLFRLIEELVKWENSNNENILRQVRAEIHKSTGGNPPPVLDPFAGGGSIPLEAQRLGLKAYASDLNPVAVLINKALIEIPPKFAGRPPVNPHAQQSLMGSDWHGTRGLADDIRYYGKWMRDEAEKRIGHLYPKVTLPKEYGGGEATVIAWLWARTVTCPNPACGAKMPLVRSFYLSTKKGKEAWVEPQIDHNVNPTTIQFDVKTGQGQPQDGTVNRQGARCIACGSPVPLDYIRSEGKVGRISAQLMAIVAEGQHGRAYISPNEEQADIAQQAKPSGVPETDLPEQALGFRVQLYGMTKHRDLFTSRQLAALTTFSDLVQEARDKVLHDASSADLPINGISLNDGGVETNAYAGAVATYLALAVDKGANLWSSICSWMSDRGAMRETFARQAISMIWDFAEANPFSDSGGNIFMFIERISDVIEYLPNSTRGTCEQSNATSSSSKISPLLISTDPPYYDNIGYADLSDFFYIWLRRSLRATYPDLFKTMLVPKVQELIATPYRFEGSKSKAQEFFEIGLAKAFEHMRAIQHPDYPLTVYYAFRQSESDDGDGDQEDNVRNGVAKNGNTPTVTASTGWETMLTGLISSGFTITGTWPMHTEGPGRARALDSNALASSIVLVCRPRPLEVPIASRREFLNALRLELPLALKNLQRGSIAPVDLAQASIGPGMSIYSRYSKVVESDGKPMSVRTALQLINRALDEALAEQEGEYDGETRWAIAWFEQYAMNAAEYGVAETLSKAKNTTVHSLVDAGLLEARSGKVRLLKREEFPRNGS
jgi:putative DNA methylase